MFARFVTLLPIAALAAVAAAAPNALEARTAPTCNSGSVYCCNQTFSNKADFGSNLLSGLLGLILGLGANAGVSCSPITVIGALSNGAQCTQQTACCTNVSQTGLINFACDPIALNA